MVQNQFITLLIRSLVVTTLMELAQNSIYISTQIKETATMIKSRAISIFALFLIVGLFTVAIGSDSITGEYLEARSVSVYVGACHFGSEYIEGGKEATIVWNISQGTWKGVSLQGLTVVAVVSAQNNLDIDLETRRSVLYISNKANQLQQETLIDLIKKNYMKTLGQLIETKVATINFQKNGLVYDVAIGKVLSLSATTFPCHDCTQPHQIWYSPLSKINNTAIGKSTVYSYQDKSLSVKWEIGQSINNIFVGQFSI